METVIGYVRVSTGAQAEQGYGMDAQRDAISKEAERRGWSVTWVEDAAASGKDLKRPGIQRALALVESGKATTIVASRLDRLSRSVRDFADLLARAQHKGFNVVVLDPGVDLRSPHGEFIAHVIAAAAQLERRMIGERTKEGLAAAKARGVKVGRPRSTPPEVIARVIADRNAGATLAAIADGLNEDGVVCAAGGRAWLPGTVKALLTREAIA